MIEITQTKETEPSAPQSKREQTACQTGQGQPAPQTGQEQPARQTEQRQSVSQTGQEQPARQTEQRQPAPQTAKKQSALQTVQEQPAPQTTQGQSGRLSADEKKEQHLREIQAQVEEAKNPAVYETYDYKPSGADQKISLFAARRRGLSHMTNGAPCQDYCLTTSADGCTILADADGVGSCEHSDFGSKFACEAVVQAVTVAQKSCKSEEQLVSRLLSVSFRERLVAIWVRMVMEKIEEEGTLSPADRLKEFGKYGSTILFAVITENWIVTGNLGDGQILVFNDSFGVKLRMHAPKDSSRVRCLANARCAREDFQTAKYPRSLFHGVLLTTDGIYESLDKGTHFYDYGMQMKQRFLEKVPPEPFLPFCYKEEGEPFKDFSRMRTQDDCSLALALTEPSAEDTAVKTEYDALLAGILRHVQAAVPRRWSPECMSFFVKKEDIYADVVVSKEAGIEVRDGRETPDGLKSAIYEEPCATWSENGYQYSAYADTSLSTMEFLYCTGQLRRNRTRPEESEHMILDIYRKIRALKEELSSAGLALNSSAVFNIAYDGENLHVRREALRKRTTDSTDADISEIERYFSHLLGVLSSKSGETPLFDVGYIDRGIRRQRAGSTSEDLAQPVRAEKKIKLKNISTCPWELEDGSILPPGGLLELKGSVTFTVSDSQGDEPERYTYRSKELL